MDLKDLKIESEEDFKKFLFESNELTPKQKRILVKSFILTLKVSRGDTALYDAYIKNVEGESEKSWLINFLKDKEKEQREFDIKQHLDMLQLEKDILEEKIRVTREFLD